MIGPGQPGPDADVVPGGMPAAEAAHILLDGLRDQRFYIFTHPEIVRQEAETRIAWMVENLTPAYRGAGKSHGL
jgi:hypothetical protein